MADTDAELIAEVRSLTGYGTGVIPGDDMESLLSVAKDEILLETEEDDLDWYNDRPAERALYWLLALFTKIRTKEIGSAGFSIGELEQTPLQGAESFWLGQFHRHLWNIGNATPFGITSVSRTDRTYDGTTSSAVEPDDLLG